MKCDVGLLQSHTLLIILLQSQRVDGEEGHVGLEGAHDNKERGSISYCFLVVKSLSLGGEINELYMCYVVFAGLI